MGITVREAMTIGGLKQCKIIAGNSGLNNIIEYVSVIEVPSAWDWFKGKELFLTAFYSIRDNTQIQLELLNHLKEKGSSALAVCYPGLYYHQISDKVKRTADELSIPILEVPHEIAYIDIISPITEAVQEKEANKIQNALLIQSKIQNEIIKGMDIHEITKKISEIINASSIIVEQNLDVISCYSKWAEPAIINEMMNYIKNNIGKLKLNQTENVFKWRKNINVGISKIEINGLSYGFYIYFNKNNVNETLVPYISNGLALYFSNKRIIRQTQDKLKQNLIEAWFSGESISKNVFIRRLRKFNITIQDKAGMALLIFEDENNKSYILDRSKNFLSRRNSKCECLLYNNVILFFLTARTDYRTYYNELFHQMFLYLAKENCVKINVTVSNRTDQLIDEGKQLFDEMMSIQNIRSKLGFLPSILFVDDVPIFTMVPKLNKLLNVKSILNLLGPLDKYDRLHHSNLVDTLGYLLFNSNLNDICERMFIHRNTLNYRKNKINKILQINPLKSPYRLNFELAILIRNTAKHR